MVNNRIPRLSDKHKICMICEGNEEFQYIEKLKSLKVWNEQYEIIPDNADGNGNIPARYQDSYQNDSYELVLVFCDTEKKPYEQYKDIKRKINEFHGIDTADEEVIMFGNPCTMQIIIKHWTEAHIIKPAKAINAPLIEKYAGVKNYKGRADQIAAVMEHITTENYVDMCNRVRSLEMRDSVVGSSNFGRFLDYFGSDDTGWIDVINAKLDG